MKKEIIGYRLVKPEYEKAAVMVIAPKTAYPNATTFKELNAGINMGEVIFCCSSYSEELLRAAGVLDLWFEPVYKEKEFEFGRWYKSPYGVLIFVSSKSSGYGFNSGGEWMNECGNNAEWYLDNLEPATDPEVKERLLAYAREKYAEGTRFYPAHLEKEDGRFFTVISHEIKEKAEFPRNISFISKSNNGESWVPNVFYQGKWAEIISEPEKETDLEKVVCLLTEAIDKLNNLM